MQFYAGAGVQYLLRVSTVNLSACSGWTTRYRMNLCQHPRLCMQCKAEPAREGSPKATQTLMVLGPSAAKAMSCSSRILICSGGTHSQLAFPGCKLRSRLGLLGMASDTFWMLQPKGKSSCKQLSSLWLQRHFQRFPENETNETVKHAAPGIHVHFSARATRS